MNKTEAIEEAVSAVQELEERGFNVVVDNSDHLANARKFVASYLNGQRAIDIRSPDPKPEWQSGGTRSSGSLGKLLRSRERVLWNSVEMEYPEPIEVETTDEDGNITKTMQVQKPIRHGLTHRIYPAMPGTQCADPEVKRMMKKLARGLAKKHQLSFHDAKMILLARLGENLAQQGFTEQA